MKFATDVLRLAISVNLNAAKVTVYVEHASAGHADEGLANIHLLKTIWLTLWASMSGYAPHHAALAAEYRGLSQRGYKGLGWRRFSAETDELVDDFLDS